jgi:hypothetical protein
MVALRSLSATAQLSTSLALAACPAISTNSSRYNLPGKAHQKVGLFCIEQLIPARTEFDPCQNPSPTKWEREGPIAEGDGRVRAFGRARVKINAAWYYTRGPAIHPDTTSGVEAPDLPLLFQSSHADNLRSLSKSVSNHDNYQRTRSL